MKDLMVGVFCIASPFLLVWALFAGMHSSNESISFACALLFIFGWPFIGCAPIAASLLVEYVEGVK